MIRHGRNDVVKTLLGRLKPEDRFITNDEGETALDLAKNDETIALLTTIAKSAYVE